MAKTSEEYMAELEKAEAESKGWKIPSGLSANSLLSEEEQKKLMGDEEESATNLEEVVDEGSAPEGVPAVSETHDEGQGEDTGESAPDGLPKGETSPVERTDNTLVFPIKIKVYRQDYFVENLEQAVQLMQMGADYSNKMHVLKEYKNDILTVKKYPVLKQLIEMAQRDIDITKYIRFDESTSKQPVVTENSEVMHTPEPDTDIEGIALRLFDDEESLDLNLLKSGVSKIASATTSKAIKPVLDKLEKVSSDLSSLRNAMVYNRLKNEDEHFEDTIKTINFMMRVPNLMSPAMREAISTKPELFVDLFKAVRAEVIKLKAAGKPMIFEATSQQAGVPTNTPKAVTVPTPTSTPASGTEQKQEPLGADKRVEEILKRSEKPKKPPVLEGSSASGVEEPGSQVLKDMWEMPDEQFDKLMRSIDKKNRRYR